VADTIYLVRHAAPPREARGKYWGKRDPGVDTDSLRDAARLAAKILRPPDRIVSSSLERARATVEAMAAELGQPYETACDVEEIDFGEFDGLSYREIQTRFPDAARRWAEAPDGFVFPGGSGILEFDIAAGASWRNYSEARERTLLIVTHGGIISTWTCLFLGLDPSRRFSFHPDYAALTVFARHRGGEFWEMASFNDRH
jgi:broad specificity phosphatase PhoE